MSKRQQIVDYLSTELKKILKTNGYNTDAGKNVFEWRDTPLQKTELPGIVFRDNLVNKTAGTIGMFRWLMRLEIAIFGKSASEIRSVIEDVIRVIGNCSETRFGGVAADVEIPEGEIVIERHDIVEGAAVLNFDVIYDAAKWSI